MTGKELETETQLFFDRRSKLVVPELAAEIYQPGVKRSEFEKGTPKTLLVPTLQGEKEFLITLAQAYSEEEATKLWGGERLNQLRALNPADVIAYYYRAATLPFVKTKDGDNILLRELLNLETRGTIPNPTAITRLLGLSHGMVGRLTLVDEDSFRFSIQ